MCRFPLYLPQAYIFITKTRSKNGESIGSRAGRAGPATLLGLRPNYLRCLPFMTLSRIVSTSVSNSVLVTTVGGSRPSWNSIFWVQLSRESKEVSSQILRLGTRANLSWQTGK